jgi:hypothetical protein
MGEILWLLSKFSKGRVGVGGLWCLTTLSSIFQLYRGDQFYWWNKPDYLEKSTDLPHCML